MNGHNKRGRHRTWSNLPTQILRIIAKLLETDFSSLRHFRLVCKNWNHPTTIPSLLPYRAKAYGHYTIFTSTVYLVNSSWIILSVEFTKDQYKYRQVFSKSHFVDLPSNFDLTRFQSRRLSTQYYMSVVAHSSHPLHFYAKVLVSSPKLAPCMDDCAALCLFFGGKLVGYPPFKHVLNSGGDECRVKLPQIQISYGSVNEFDDVVEFRGMVIAVDRLGKLYEIDLYTLDITRVYLDKGVSNSTVKGWRKRLVGSSVGDLYLVVRQTLFYLNKPRSSTSKPLFKVYKLRDKGKVRIWTEVKSFGNRVMFVTVDGSFFVGVDGSSQNLKNCMVYSKLAFVTYCKLGWRPCFPADDQNGVFRLDGDGQNGVFQPVFSFENFPFVLDSCPSWAHQSPPPTPHSPSQGESEDGFESVEDESNHDMDENKEEESNLFDSDETESYLGNDNDQVLDFESDTEVTPVPSNRQPISLVEPQGSSGGENAETRSWACIPSASKGSQADSSRPNFRGLNICSDLVPILENIWSNHGNIIEKIAIRNGNIVATTLESLANAVQILEDNTGRSLTNEQADYLSSTLDDLQHMRFRVDWLAPKITGALAHHKSKHLMSVFDSIKGVTRAKAQVSERKGKLSEEIGKLLEEVSKCDEMERELDSEIAKLYQSIPASARELDFDRSLGGVV